MKRLLLLLAACAVALWLPASAMAFNQRITVYASVPQMRYIYVNKDGIITKIAGNTSNNIEPKVVDENNQPLTMTESIKQQYQQFLKSHNWHLEASKIYKVNPLRVNEEISQQKIEVASKLQVADLAVN